MKATDALAALKAHLQKHGFGDIDVNMTGGYDPTTTPADAPFIQSQVAVLKAAGSIRSCGPGMPDRIRVTFSRVNR
jgi:hypothetical protein